MAYSIEELRPQLVLNVMDRKLGLLGYVVLDRTIDGCASGGIRMAPDLTLQEVANLAREMTFKFGFLNIPCGGAKAGIIASSTLSPQKRRQILLAFGKSLAPLLSSGIYGPGTDMGTSPVDMYYILKGGGRKVQRKAFQNTESGHYAALTVFTTAEKLVEYSGLSLPNCSVAVEGFGKLGISAAKLFSDVNAKIVAISTIEGAIYNHKGLDISELIILEHKFGDKVVANYRDAKVIRKGELLTLDVDILVLCAGPHTLTPTNIRDLKAKIVVPGANIAASDEAENLMFERGIHYTPGFVSNCGEVLRHFLSTQGFSDKDVSRMIKERFGRRISNLLTISHSRGVSLGRIAMEISKQRLREMEQREQNGFSDSDVLIKLLTSLSTWKLLPYRITLILRWLVKSLAISRTNKIFPDNAEGDRISIQGL